MNEELRTILTRVDSIRWYELEDAYGYATRTPLLLRDLLSDDEDERCDAVNDLLWSRAYHQFCVYSVTADVVRIVLDIIRVPTYANRVTLRDLTLLEECVHFCRACVDRSRMSCDDPEDIKRIDSAVRSGVELYRTLSHHENRHVAKDAAWLLQYCSTARM